jgi:hypothetical protein
VLTAALAIHLASLGLVKYPPIGAGSGVPCYIEVQPSTPDTCVTILSRAGFPSPDLSGYETPELQAIVRASAADGPNIGQRLAERIRRAIAREPGTALYPAAWAYGTAEQASVLRADAITPSPLALGADPTGRLRWSVSWQIEVPTREVAI